MLRDRPWREAFGARKTSLEDLKPETEAREVEASVGCPCHWEVVVRVSVAMASGGEGRRIGRGDL